MRLLSLLLLVEISLSQQDIIINFPDVIQVNAQQTKVAPTVNVTVRGQPIFLVMKMTLQSKNKSIGLSRDQLSFTTPNQTESFKITIVNPQVEGISLVNIKMYGKVSGYRLSNQGKMYVHFINKPNNSCVTPELPVEIITLGSNFFSLNLTTQKSGYIFYSAQERRYLNNETAYPQLRYLAQRLRGPKKPKWLSHKSGQSIYSYTSLSVGQNIIAVQPLLPETDYLIYYYVEYDGCLESNRSEIVGTTESAYIFRFEISCNKQISNIQLNRLMSWLLKRTGNAPYNILTIQGLYANYSQATVQKPNTTCLSLYEYRGPTNGTNKILNLYLYTPFGQFDDYSMRLENFYDQKNGLWNDFERSISMGIPFVESIRLSGKLSAHQLKNNPEMHTFYITMDGVKDKIYSFQLKEMKINKPGILYFLLMNQQNSPLVAPSAQQIVNCYNSLNRSAIQCVRFLYNTGNESYNISFQRHGLSIHHLYYTATNEYPRIPIAQGSVHLVVFEPRKDIDKNMVQWSVRLRLILLLILLIL